MKKTVLSLALAVIFGSAATATTPIDGEKKEIKADASSITWRGYKVTGEHAGTIDLKKGHLMFENGKLSGGEFEVDMTSIVTTDDLGDMKPKLEGHLKSDDFFGVEKHPTAKLVITGSEAFDKNSYTVQGDLTIKGITKPITLVVSVFENKATASMKVDRAKYDVKYGSGSFFENLGDKMIYDEFDLVVELVF